jgi:hypothetical protein
VWGEVGEVAAIRRRQLLTIAVQLCILKFVECALPNSDTQVARQTENSLFPGFQKEQFDHIFYRNFHPKLRPNLSNPGHGGVALDGGRRG